MSAPSLTLVSHHLCPYVQRAAIVLLEKGVAFERRWVDLADKPAWFLALSPLGKTPVLLADDVAVFDSAVICEYLDETLQPRLHPLDALQRARHRSWMEFGSAMLNTIWAFYTAPDAAGLQARRDELSAKLEQLEAQLDAQGPYFAGPAFGMVDAVFAPAFRYFDVFEALGEPVMPAGLQRLAAWREALGRRASVREAVLPDYAQRLARFLEERGSELARRIAAREAAAA